MSRKFSQQAYLVWLGTCLVLIALMVVIGGYTRLTDSGLSIMEWRLFTGILPPFTDSAWQEVFDLYQEIPQFKQVNFAMDLSGFKQIFWLEYLHRLLGRLIGLVIIVPSLIFYTQTKKRPEIRRKLLLFSVLVIAQGVMGWFMVASGLQDLVSVSHYRLAAHLLLAFILFSLIALEFYNNKYKKIDMDQSIVSAYGIVKCFYVLLVIQIVYGAFVAGLDAGLIYNQYPLMGDKLYPEEIYMVNVTEFFFSNIATIQFIHRVLAIILCVLGARLFYKGLHKINLGQSLLILLFLQFLLGISTIITVVNMHVAALHQLFALLLFTNSTILLQNFKRA